MISICYRLDRKVEILSRQLDDNSGFGGIIGNSEEMKAVYAITEKAAISDAPIIIFRRERYRKRVGRQSHT